jgi:RNA polymerase sigma factor (sigma-70 family)
MASFPVTRAFERIRRLAQAGADADQTDRQLLERFVLHRDEAAFALLVRRHGPMVLGVCRRVLRHHQDAEDAFQAAFLVLARKAAAIRGESASAWLFQVAYHVALDMKSKADRCQTQPVPLDSLAAPQSNAAANGCQAALDEELGRLPEKYRAPLLLCHAEGLSRDEAARQLGWKPGAVKIRLERARALLRLRLARRGLASAAIGFLLEDNIATAAVPAGLTQATATAALTFSQGALPASAAPAIALAQGALRAMTIKRLKTAALFLALLLGLAGGPGLLALSAGTDSSHPGDTPAVPQAVVREVALVPLADDPPRPVRVLLFTGGPTREFQFVRRLFVNQVDRKQAELSICIQVADPNGERAQDVPGERLLKRFPDSFDPKKDDKAEERFYNLARYDLVVAFDPDWREVPLESQRLLKKWVEDGGGLVVIAGPINTYQLARGTNADKLKPVIDLLPVELEDSRLAGLGIDRVPGLERLAFTKAAKKASFLNLDGDRDDPLAAWEEFFTGQRGKDKEERKPVRGFYTWYPVKSIKDGGSELASVGVAGNPPFLVTGEPAKGRVVFLAWGDTWRLRQYREDWHERFWDELARYAASIPAAPRGAAAPGRQLSPEERQAVTKGLIFLAKSQYRDGHWDGKDGTYPVALTAVAGQALLMEGSTLQEGKYSDHIRRAADWLIDRSQRDGLIGNPNNPTEARRHLIGHGHALLFLASVYGEEEDSERRKRLEEVLTRAVLFSGKAQLASGAWGDTSTVAEEDQVEQSLRRSTLIQLLGLRAARGAGISVPRAMIVSARKFLDQSVKANDPVGPSAAALAFAPADLGAARIKKWQPDGRVDVKAPGLGIPSLQYFAQGLLAFQLGEDGFGKLVPDSRPDQRLTWSRYRLQMFVALVSTQNADGSWDDVLGKEHGTAIRLAILQLENGALPIYQR